MYVSSFSIRHAAQTAHVPSPLAAVRRGGHSQARAAPGAEQAPCSLWAENPAPCPGQQLRLHRRPPRAGRSTGGTRDAHTHQGSHSNTAPCPEPGPAAACHHPFPGPASSWQPCLPLCPPLPVRHSPCHQLEEGHEETITTSTERGGKLPTVTQPSRGRVQMQTQYQHRSPSLKRGNDKLVLHTLLQPAL